MFLIIIQKYRVIKHQVNNVLYDTFMKKNEEE